MKTCQLGGDHVPLAVMGAPPFLSGLSLILSIALVRYSCRERVNQGKGLTRIKEWKGLIRIKEGKE